MKRIVLLAMSIVLSMVFLSACGQQQNMQVSDEYVCKNFELKIKDPVLVPPTKRTGTLAVICDITNKSGKDKSPQDFILVDCRVNGRSLSTFKGNPWNDTIESHGYSDSATQFHDGEQITAYRLFTFIVDNVNSDDILHIRFYKKGLSDDSISSKSKIIAEKEVAIKDVLTLTESPSTIITESIAKANAKEDFSKWGARLLAAKLKINAVENVKIGSSTCSFDEETSKYTVIFKGTFWEVDEYGKVGHLYDYTAEYSVDAYDGDTSTPVLTVSKSNS